MDLLPARKLSCGVVILNDAAELLLCHVTGQGHWDLPKGGAEPGESPRQTALRETREETGLVLDAQPLVDLGRHRFRPRKDLHLFATLMPRLDPAGLFCVSHFECGHSGAVRPEMDGYGWFAFGRLDEDCKPALAELLTHRLQLQALLVQLRRRHALAA